MDNVEEPNIQEESTHAESECAAMQGVEEISLCDENEDDTDEVDGGGCNFSPETALNCTDDLGKLNIKEISSENVMKFHFPDVAVAFAFYNLYACMNGFAARKGHVLRNCNGEIIQQTFLCHREGHKEVKHNHPESKRRRPKPVTRCGCKARCILHIEANNGRWYIKYFSDVHNHTLVENGYSGMISAHRKMTEYDKFQMNGMREVGISTPHIFGLFAIQAGGFEKVGFNKRDMYNEQLRQRRHHFSDAKAALDFLEDLGKKDSMMFWRHTVDEDGRLEHLFWCDGVARGDFSVFGDVLAFDATYGKNRYKCPLVVFSGVNHHIQSIVFAAAIVANETEETYVWLLEQLLAAMGGKSPESVITDGDLAMKNAITRVFPRARHRLCAWHLIRNATSNVKNPQFVSRFKQCMLGDYDVGEFNRKWDEMVSDFGLEENTWVTEMYQKRRMWATAYIRGNFFAGFRTTSRCEGLHSEFGKYVNHQHTLLDFLKHFFRWLSYMRYREVESDFSSSYGELVLETHLKFLERSAANVFTKEVFLLFRPVLERALTCKVEGTRQTATCFMYKVRRYHKEGLEWCVFFCPTSLQFRCSCERMESLGIPCEHLVSVMVHLDIIQLPSCLVLIRWTKAAKDSIGLANKDTSRSRDASSISQYLYLVERCKRMANAALDCEQSEYMRKTIDMVDAQTAMLESVRLGDNVAATDVDSWPEGIVRNPLRVRTKGCGAAPSSGQKKGKKASRKTHTCGVCGQKGHNRKSCHVHSQTTLLSQTQAGSSVGHLDEDNADEDFFYATIDTIMVASTTLMLFTGRFELAPSANRKATAGLKLEARDSGLQTGDPAGFTLADTLACGTVGHIIGAGVVLGLKNTGAL